jgi:hypothetical protein
MEWNGYRDHEVDVGDGWDAIENCSFYKGGACIRRLGFGAKVDLSSAVIRSGTENGNYALLATAAGAVLAVVQSTGVVSSLTTGLNTTNWPNWASINSRSYLANGSDAIKVTDDGTNFRTAGITAPATACTASATGSGGVVDVGTHLFRYRYYDSSRNRLSDPSVAASATPTAGQKVDVGYTTLVDATVDKIIIEATAAGAETYYRVATVNNATATYTFNTADATLIVGVAASRDGEFQHQAPPVADIIAEHRQRGWLWKISNSELYWSRAGFPESWDSVNYVRKVTMGNGDTPSALASFYSDLYCIGQRSMRRLVYTSDPAAAMLVDVPGNFGCFNARCVIKVDGGLLLGWGRNGAWMIDAMQPKKISRAIDDTMAAISDATKTTQRFVCYEPIRREVYFCFPLSGDTVCKAAFVWSMDTNEWTLYKYRQGITAAVLNTQYSDRQRLMICDGNGYAWRIGVAANDGGGDGVLTVGIGSTTTVIQATNAAVVGQTLYNPATGEERLITVATGSAITVSALAAAPTAGTILYVGSIRQRLLTDWFPGDGLNEKKRPTTYQMAVRPDDDMGTAKVYYYHDFSSTAATATSFAADTLPEGVSVASGVLNIDLDAGATDGFIGIPTTSDWKRAIQTEIIAETPLDGVQFIACEFKNDASVTQDKE